MNSSTSLGRKNNNNPHLQQHPLYLMTFIRGLSCGFSSSDLLSPLKGRLSHARGYNRKAMAALFCWTKTTVSQFIFTTFAGMWLSVPGAWHQRTSTATKIATIDRDPNLLSEGKCNCKQRKISYIFYPKLLFWTIFQVLLYKSSHNALPPEIY